MRGSICGMLALVVFVGLAIPVAGQASMAQTTTGPARPTPVARLPYMAEFKILRVQTVANETALAHESTVVDARDSHGRHITATTVLPMSADRTATTHFQVFDPVAHVTFNWNSPGREATVMAIPFSGAIPPGCSYMSFGIGYANEKTEVEDLGSMTILGVEARGRRTSTTIPFQPIGKHRNHQLQARTIEVRSSELWQASAPGLNGLVVREVNADALSVKMSKELVNFRQGEPDAALFHPPIGYEIVSREVNADPCVSFGEMEPAIAPNPVLPQPPVR